MTTLQVNVEKCIKCNLELPPTEAFWRWNRVAYCNKGYEKVLMYNPSNIEERVARLEKEVARLTMHDPLSNANVRTEIINGQKVVIVDN